MLVVIKIPVISRGFSGIRIARCIVFCVDYCLSFYPFSIGHCAVCSSSIYGFWLPLWYPQTLLTSDITITRGLCTNNRKQCIKVTRRDDTILFNQLKHYWLQKKSYIWWICYYYSEKHTRYFPLYIYKLETFLARLCKYFKKEFVVFPSVLPKVSYIELFFSGLKKKYI